MVDGGASILLTQAYVAEARGTRPMVGWDVVGAAADALGAVGEFAAILFAGSKIAKAGAVLSKAEAAVVRTVTADSEAIKMGAYGKLTGELKGTGLQANHLNQNAAFRDIIPHDEGLANAMRGNAFTETGSPHYEFHSSLEEFWSPYRKGGDLFGKVPTNDQYGIALERALAQSGYTLSEASSVAGRAAAQRASYGLQPTAAVPRIPGRLNQTKR